MPGRILIVDDYAAVAAVAATMVTMEGYEACVASSGREALEALEAFEPDLVILDLMLGDSVRGEDVLDRLRARGSKVPVLVLSALVVPGGVSFDGQPNVETMAKPFKVRDLSARVAAMLARRWSREDGSHAA